jgi:hypothetical protein
MVHDDAPVRRDVVQVSFDDERAVSDAGIVLIATLAARLGIEALAQRFVRLRPDHAGARNAGRKVMALIYAMVLGANCIDDCDVLRVGRTRRLLGGWIAAPSTLGTVLRAFTFGHVRQLDRVSGVALTRAWKAGAGPGCGRLVVDIDSFIGEVHGYRKQGAAFGYTGKRGYHPMLATRADTGEVLHVRLRKGSAASPRGALRFVDELIARVDRAGATGKKLFRGNSAFWNTKLMARLERLAVLHQRAPAILDHRRDHRDRRQLVAAAYGLPPRRRSADSRDDHQRQAPGRASHPADRRPGRAVPDWRHFAFLTNRTEPIGLVEAEHRQHAVVELAIRDLKDQALAHFPSAHYSANSAWTVIACLTHNLLRWTSLLGLPGHTIRAARTLRRRLLAIPGRLTRNARQWTLHLPARWPWQQNFSSALARIRTLPAAA